LSSAYAVEREIAAHCFGLEQRFSVGRSDTPPPSQAECTASESFLNQEQHKRDGLEKSTSGIVKERIISCASPQAKAQREKERGLSKNLSIIYGISNVHTSARALYPSRSPDPLSKSVDL